MAAQRALESTRFLLRGLAVQFGGFMEWRRSYQHTVRGSAIDFEPEAHCGP